MTARVHGCGQREPRILGLRGASSAQAAWRRSSLPRCARPRTARGARADRHDRRPARVQHASRSPSVATLWSLCSWSGQPARETTLRRRRRPASRRRAGGATARRAACRPCRRPRCRRCGRRCSAPVVRHRGREGDAAAVAAAGQRALRRGGGGDRGGHAGHDLALDAGLRRAPRALPRGGRRRSGRRPSGARRTPPRARACTSSALIVSWPVLSRRARVRHAAKPRLPTSIQRAFGAKLAQRRVGRAHRTARRRRCARRCAPRTVIRSAAPGPAPMKTTRAGVATLASSAARAKRGRGSITSPW